MNSRAAITGRPYLSETSRSGRNFVTPWATIFRLKCPWASCLPARFSRDPATIRRLRQLRLGESRRLVPIQQQPEEGERARTASASDSTSCTGGIMSACRALRTCSIRPSRRASPASPGPANRPPAFSWACPPDQLWLRKPKEDSRQHLCRLRGRYMEDPPKLTATLGLQYVYATRLSETRFRPWTWIWPERSRWRPISLSLTSGRKQNPITGAAPNCVARSSESGQQ